MGVPGTVGMLAKHGDRWSSQSYLRGGKLIVDATDGMYWFLKRNLFAGRQLRPDKFGFNLVELQQLLRNFFAQLRAADVTPVLVFSGARPLESQHGQAASKSLHLEKSARIRMLLLNNRGARMDHEIVPPAATTVLKQLALQLKLECHQSVYETYPLMADLAERNSCPVFTAHSDFIFTPVRKGFILASEHLVPTGDHLATMAPEASRRATSSQLPVKLYQHNLFVQDLHLEQHREALRCLYTLLRPDFSGRHPAEVNRVLGITNEDVRCRPDDGSFVHGRPIRQPCARRLNHVLHHWPRELNTLDSGRRLLVQAGASQATLSEYDIMHLTFTQPDELDATNAELLMPASLVQTFRVPDTLLHTCASATFLLDLLMNQKIFNRGTMEDTRTTRSAFSMADPVRQTIQRFASGRLDRLTLFDRRRNQLEFRNLEIVRRQSSGTGEQLNDRSVFEAFLFPAEVSSGNLLAQWIERENLLIGRALAGDLSQHLVVMLLLARFAYLLAFRNDYVTPQLSASEKSKSSSESSKDSNASKSLEEPKPPKNQAKNAQPVQERRASSPANPLAREYEPFRKHFLNAIYICFIHHAWIDKENRFKIREPSEDIVDDQHKDGFLSAVRLTSAEVRADKVSANSDISDKEFIQIRHLVELMNATVHVYCEVNALAEPRAAQLRLGEYYDGTLVYRIIKCLRAYDERQTLGKLNLMAVERKVMELLNRQL